MYKKYTLEEVKPIIEDLVKESIFCENSLKNPFHKKLIDLTHYNTPIRDDKKCCLNCSYVVCHLRDYSKYCYCEQYNPKAWPVIYYQKPVFNKNQKEPSLEERIEKDVKNYLEDYKKVLNYCKELEDVVPEGITTQPFDQETLDKEKDFQEEQKKYWTEFGATFDREKIKIDGDELFNGATLYTAKPNKEKQKAFFEKWSKCPVEMFAEEAGLTKKGEKEE